MVAASFIFKSNNGVIFTFLKSTVALILPEIFADKMICLGFASQYYGKGESLGETRMTMTWLLLKRANEYMEIPCIICLLLEMFEISIIKG